MREREFREAASARSIRGTYIMLLAGCGYRISDIRHFVRGFAVYVCLTTNANQCRIYSHLFRDTSAWRAIDSDMVE